MMNILHMTATKVIKIAKPSGKSVPLYMFPHTSFDGLNLGSPWSCRFEAAEGIIMITMKSARMLKDEPTELKLAIQRVGMLLMQPWISMMSVVSRKTWYGSGT